MTNAFTTLSGTQQRLDLYLRLQLSPDTQALIPMKQMQEVIIVPIEQITPIPNMPESVVGLLNQRSRVIWVIDLSQLLDLPPLNPNLQEYNIAIIKVDNHPMGLIVQQVHGVIRLSEEKIQSPIGTVHDTITPYLKGCLIQPSEGILLVLDARAIMNASPLTVNSKQ